MPVSRGSKFKLKGVKETTFGVTPTDPVLIELPTTGFTRNFNRNAIRSNQIRSHPFTDRLMKGQLNADFEIPTEMQDDSHDMLLDCLMGSTTWATNILKVTDALQGLTLEAEAIDLAKFDIMSGAFITSGDFNFPAEENGIVTATYAGMARSISPDANSSVVGAGSVTAAPDVDPFVFQDATVTIAGVSTPVTSLTFKLERTVDPLLVLGSATPREYIPAGVSLTGSITIPLEDNTQSGQLVNMTALALVARAADSAGTAWRQFSMPKVKFTRMGRQVQGRGGILQAIDFEAIYDSASATVMTTTRSV